MILYPQNYTKATPAKSVDTDARKTLAKMYIKGIVDRPMHYEEVIKAVETEMGLWGIDNIIEVINEVRDEWHPVEAEKELGKDV